MTPVTRESPVIPSFRPVDGAVRRRESPAASMAARYLTWVVAAVVVPMPLMLALSLELPTIYLGRIAAMQIGVAAYAWMLAAVVLSVRPRWLDRSVGLPHLYAIHGGIALFAIVAALVHDQLSSSTGLVKQTGTMALILLIGLGCWSVVFMSGWLTSRIPLLARIRSLAERLAHHELSVWLHRLNLVAVLLVFTHVQLITYISSLRWFMVVFDVMTAATLLVYVAGKIRMRTTALSGVLLSSRVVAPRVHEIRIRVDVPTAMRWEAGDFAFLRFPGIEGMGEYHPFSIVDAPRRSASMGANGRRSMRGMRQVVWTFDIREDGDFTRRAGVMTPGSRVTLLPPFGRIQRFLEEHPAAPIVIIAGGIGVTPMLAVVEGFAARTALVVYTAKRGSLLPAAEGLRRLVRGSGGRTIIQEGRLNASRMETTVIPGAVYLVAGPARMQRIWMRFLRRRGVPASRMYNEPFAW
ncbi:ferric reductase [uncultured Bifidobacterium sp.]|uniref:ferric reductase n=1 Tax=uncultured Bifidobacterium sp. TaxID=165187 RepID=UPI0028DBF15C|nr:ferric reductase [uncultured Bifidobacterium sp.]